ncbi:hypothetical protein GCM10009712_37280 [Pseudarthrobacter sulfonivorans]|uniref:hypothetical protein n=1 Tax=Pseudarthrobacter sulfonivorans TaxID=121292 RepID=UPI00168AAB39|nr:hypothetical protein [Pseudarthrobacter sulfonivorans]
MDTNPVLKPKHATPALILSSAVVFVCVVSLAGTIAANWQPTLFLLLAAWASVFLAGIVGMIWFARARRLRAWKAAASEKWNHFDDMKRTHGTTTEVTVLSVDSLQPTGSWITIRWDRFEHVQSAWMEALHDPIWPGSILLIAPDPAQVAPGSPWPTTYYIEASHCLAWAPGSVAQKRLRPHG